MTNGEDGHYAGGTVAYAAFYRFGLIAVYDFYAKFSPVYNQSLYMTRYIEQVGPVLLFFGMLGFVLSFAHTGRGFAEGNEILVIRAIVPLLLATWARGESYSSCLPSSSLFN